MTESHEADSRRPGLSRMIGVLMLVAALVLAACGSGDSSSEDDGAGSGGDTAPSDEGDDNGGATDPEDLSGEITLWAWGAGLEGEKIQERIEYFNSIYPNVTVNWEPLARNGYEEYPQLLSRFAAGNPPDVMRVLNFQPTQLVAEDALLALDDFIAAETDLNMDDYLETTVEGAKVDGVMYGLPDNAEPYVIYYNRDAFEAAGLPDPQEQFEAGEWDQAAIETAIDGLMSDGGMRFGLAFESWNYDTFCFMGGGDILQDDGVTPAIDEGACPDMLQWFADLVADEKAPSPIVGGGAQLEAFRNGEVGMYLMGPWWYGALEGTTDFDYDVTGLPAFNGVTAGKIELGSLAIARDSQNPEAAWAFVKTVTDTEGLRIWSAVATPTRRSALEVAGFNDDPWKRHVVSMVENGTWTPFTTSGAAVDTAAMTALDDLWSGRSTAADATRAAADAIADALND